MIASPWRVWKAGIMLAHNPNDPLTIAVDRLVRDDEVQQRILSALTAFEQRRKK
jgi:hypothetical protein